MLIFSTLALGLRVHQRTPAFVAEKPLLQTSQVPSGSRSPQRDLEPRARIQIAPATSTATASSSGSGWISTGGDIFFFV